MASGITLMLLIASALMVFWLWFRPQLSIAGLGAQSVAALALIAAGWSAAVWTVVPRWTMLVVLIFWLVAMILAAPQRLNAVLPKGIAGWTAILFSLVLLAFGGWATAEAILGQYPPKAASIELALPLNGNDLAIANGGSRLLINAHQDTLDLSIPRHRLWQGQSYAVDFVALRPWGGTASVFQPADPARYAIFGRAVKAPCTGQVIRLRDGRPDMPVPEVDPDAMEGNFVMLRCGAYEIAMAHLKRNSVKVRLGDQVRGGTEIGQVGNSGQSSEPHLHISAQTPGTDTAPFSGKPIAMLFNGRFLARNDRVK